MTQLNGETTTPAFTDGMTRAMRDGQEAATKAPERIGEQMQAAGEVARGVSSDVLNYVGQRFQAHADHMHRLARCRTPQSVMEQQVAFMQSSIQQFNQGFAKLYETAKHNGISGRQQS